MRVVHLRNDTSHVLGHWSAQTPAQVLYKWDTYPKSVIQSTYCSSVLWWCEFDHQHWGCCRSQCAEEGQQEAAANEGGQVLRGGGNDSSD